MDVSGRPLAALTAVACSALAGYAVGIVAGRETVTVAAITFATSPGWLALYGGVGAGVFLATLWLVLLAIDRLEEDAG